MADPGNYGGHVPEWDSPAIDAAAVTVSDSVADPSGPFRAIWVGGAGNVKLTTIGGSTVTLGGVNAGTLIPISVSRVWSAGTTVASPGTAIIGLK